MEAENTTAIVGSRWAENKGRKNKKSRPCQKINQDSLPP